MVGSLSYDVGTPLRMGPGYFPLLVGAILAALGLAVVAQGFIAGARGRALAAGTGPIPWRAVIAPRARGPVLRIRPSVASDWYRPLR